MDPTIRINERVDVVATYYAKGQYMTLCIPRKMRWRNHEITFAEEDVFRFPTVQGKRMIHVFHVSDKTNNYRLEYDAENLTWTLVAMMEGVFDYELPSE